MSNTQWQFSDTVGRFRVETDTINGRSTKVITCKTAGSLYLKREEMQQEAGASAFGEWEFWHYRTAGAVSRVALVSSTPTLTAFNGYAVYVQGADVVYLLRYDAGAIGSFMFYSIAGQALRNAWLKFRVSRTVAGIFTLYVNDALPVRDGGANPTVADAAYLTSNYIVIEAQVGDKLALGSVDGANAFVKRLKG